MIAAVTNFYNPSKSDVKTQNFNKFRESIGEVPLFIIEAAFKNDPFILKKENNLTQVRCKDLIWQQYRLINIIIKKLPDKFDKVVWIDADIIFDNKSWHEDLSDLLDNYKVVQNYSSAHLLYPDGKIQEEKTSVAYEALKNYNKPNNTLFSSCLDMSTSIATGFSWGIQRDVVEKFGIYDYWITGSSDNALCLGIWGDWSNRFIKERLNEKMNLHFMEWAEPFYEYINKSVSYREGTIKHLWHGFRNYRKRWHCLRYFDPFVDVNNDINCVLEWTNNATKEIRTCCENMCLNYDRKFFI